MNQRGSAHTTHAAHVEHGFIRTYIFSTDHKMIGRQYLFYGLFMMILGGFLALLVRWQLAWPEQPVLGFGWLFAETEGVITANTYNMLFTMHATIMVFFVIMPILVGAFGNFLIPLMIGARDMAFPVLNMLSFWVALPAAIIMLGGFFVPGGHAAAGWTSYAPLSANPVFTGVEWGQNLWCISLIILGFSSMMGAINYITTVINMRAPGMTFFRLPLVIWSLFIVAILVLLAIPVLTSALAMLLFDRLFGTTFFLPPGGVSPCSGNISFGSLATQRCTSSSCQGWALPPTSCPPSPASRSSAIAPWCTPSSASGSCPGSSGVTICSRAA